MKWIFTPFQKYSDGEYYDYEGYLLIEIEKTKEQLHEDDEINEVLVKKDYRVRCKSLFNILYQVYKYVHGGNSSDPEISVVKNCSYEEFRNEKNTQLNQMDITQISDLTEKDIIVMNLGHSKDAKCSYWVGYIQILVLINILDMIGYQTRITMIDDIDETKNSAGGLLLHLDVIPFNKTKRHTEDEPLHNEIIKVSPLLKQAQEDADPLYRRLLQYNCDNKMFYTGICAAVDAGDIDIVKRSLNQIRNNELQRSFDNIWWCTAVKSAVRQGSIDMLDVLLADGKIPKYHFTKIRDHKCNNGIVLVIAAEIGHSHIVEYLLKCIYREYSTVYDWFFDSNHHKLPKEYRDFGPQYTKSSSFIVALAEAIENKHVEVVRKMVGYRLDKDMIYNNLRHIQSILLHRAIRVGNDDIINTLYELCILNTA
jgi:hypothetical protein